MSQVGQMLARRRKGVIAFVVTLVLATLVAGAFVHTPTRDELGRRLYPLLHPSDERVFPDLDPTRMTPLQQQLVANLKADFAAQPPATMYSEGVSEPWCADFVSWHQRAIGRPFVNPHSKGWRIPGVHTLAEYLQSTGQFRSTTEGFTPVVGDIILYREGGLYDRHVQYVLEAHGDDIVTIGGNEGGQIRVSRFRITPAHRVMGYGDLTP